MSGGGTLTGDPQASFMAFYVVMIAGNGTRNGTVYGVLVLLTEVLESDCIITAVLLINAGSRLLREPRQYLQQT